MLYGVAYLLSATLATGEWKVYANVTIAGLFHIICGGGVGKGLLYTVLEERLHGYFRSVVLPVFMPTKWLNLSICLEFWISAVWMAGKLYREEGRQGRNADEG